jgi:hypothetical protein
MRRLALWLAGAAVVVGIGLIIFFIQLNELSQPVGTETTAASPGQGQPRPAAAVSPAGPPAASTGVSQLPQDATGGPPPGSQTPQASPGRAGALVGQPQGTAPPPAPTPEASGGPPASGGVTLAVRATGRSWILVSADGRTLFVGFILNGETMQWQSSGAMTVRVGNAGVVEVTVNGKSLGVLGRSGEVVDRTFGANDGH